MICIGKAADILRCLKLSDSAVLVVLPLLEVYLIAPTLIKNVENGTYCNEHSAYDRKKHIENLFGVDLIFFTAH